MKGRTIMIGDVHGCLRELDLLLDSLQPSRHDEVLFLGDLIHKGPDSLGVLRRARELDARCLLGNHEWRLWRYRQNAETVFLKPQDFALMAQMNERDWVQIDEMSLSAEFPEHGAVAVHGGFLPHKPWRRQPAEVVTRIQVIDEEGRPLKRSQAPQAKPWADFWRGPELVIYGHTPQPRIVRRPHSIGIDTGCVYGGRLTAIVFPGLSIHQIRARRRYSEGVPQSFTARR